MLSNTSLFFPLFPFCRGEAGQLSLSCMAIFVLFFTTFLLTVVGIFSPLFFRTAFLRPVFTQSSHLSCGLPRFLQPSCFFVSDLFDNLSSFILANVSSPFLPALNYSANYTSLSSNFFYCIHFVLRAVSGICCYILLYTWYTVNITHNFTAKPTKSNVKYHKNVQCGIK